MIAKWCDKNELVVCNFIYELSSQLRPSSIVIFIHSNFYVRIRKIWLKMKQGWGELCYIWPLICDVDCDTPCPDFILFWAHLANFGRISDCSWVIGDCWGLALGIFGLAIRQGPVYDKHAPVKANRCLLLSRLGRF